MRLKSLDIINFRNYDHLYLTLNSNINIFIGNNGMGKTNLLESVYVLAITKSHRLLVDNNLIRQNEKGFRIVGNLITNDTEKRLEVKITRTTKSIKVNENQVHKISSYISNLNIIIFCPDDLELLKGSPSVRRKFLNVEISQLFHNYLSRLNEYKKVLNQRNEYLKQLSKTNTQDQVYMAILNEQLVDLALVIYEYRSKYLNEINETIGSIYEDITGINNLQLQYKTSIDLDGVDLKKDFLMKLEDRVDKEIILGTTLIGPHRDEFGFYFGKDDLRLYGSQGQQRLAVIALKLAEIEMFKKYKQDYPILLLDDIFSELDRKKIQKLICYIKRDIQVIITTTELDHVDSSLLDDAFIFLIEDGKVIKKEEVDKNGK